ncbi:hypothetical protein JW921_03100, partial [Candidatus Fermentibacterales bacterium]|nr:hypothetical protein [Candidatus Fermentibacterales bacterium]
MTGEKGLRLGLVGYPVEHSLSSAIHEAFMRQTGLEGSFRRLSVRPDELPGRLASLYADDYAGLNVTVPHKRAVLAQVVACDQDVESTGAANTLLRGIGGWSAANTDIAGFGRLVLEEGLDQQQFVIVGGGGAASAVAEAVYRMGCSSATVCRRPWLWKRHGRALELERLQSVMGRRDGGVVVNATPLGWRPTDSFPVETWPERGWVFLDLNYAPDWPWRDRLAASGVRVITGERMLVYQAAASFCLWTGIGPSVEVG